MEAHIKAIGIPYTILRLPLFIDNNWGNLESIKGQGKIYGPVDANAPYASVATSDVGDAAAVILTHPFNHVNKTYDIQSSLYTHNELAKAFSTATGKQVLIRT